MADRVLPVESTCVDRDAVPNPWHSTDVAVFAGDGLSVAEVRARVAERIAYAPRWRLRVEATPFGELWVDAADFDVTAHVRALHLPERASIAQLQAAVGELLHEPLPRTGPRWEIGVVPSLRGRRSALVTRVNPAWVDGVGGVHLLSELIDDSPTADAPVPAAWEPTLPPEPEDLLVGAVSVAREPVPALLGVAHSATRAARWGLQQVGVAVPQRQQRYVAGAGAPLELFERVAQRAGVRVHDVVLACVAGALRRIGERVDPTALVPQAVADAGAVSALGFAVRPDLVVLPLRTPSPHARLEQIATLTQARVDGGGLIPAAQLAANAGFLAPTLHTVAARIALEVPTHDLLISNVPGPQEPRYFGTRELKATYPVLSQTGGQKLTIGATCYAGQVLFGLCGVRPVDALAQAMRDELHDLLAA